MGKVWLIKEFSALTNVTVQALHYYHKVGLLKPSVSGHNGYRMYSQADLIKVQQIVAFKYFGFSLKQIKQVFSKKGSELEMLQMQEQLIQEKIKGLTSAHNFLRAIINQKCSEAFISIDTITDLMKEYQMIDNLKNTWIGKQLDGKSEFDQYVHFLDHCATLKPDSSEEALLNLYKKISENIGENPASEFGEAIARELMEMSLRMRNGTTDNEITSKSTVVFEQLLQRMAKEENLDLAKAEEKEKALRKMSEEWGRTAGKYFSSTGCGKFGQSSLGAVATPETADWLKKAMEYSATKPEFVAWCQTLTISAKK